MGLKILLLLTFLHSVGWSKLIDHSVTSKKREIYSLKEACQFMGHTDLLLVEKKNRSFVNCMGKIVKVSDFCLQKFPKAKNLTRGYIEDNADQVICEKGQNVVLKLTCDQRDSKYCQSHKKGCEELGKIFAIRLELFRSSFGSFSKFKALNCYYSVKEEEGNLLHNLNLKTKK